MLRPKVNFFFPPRFIILLKIQRRKSIAIGRRATGVLAVSHRACTPSTVKLNSPHTRRYRNVVSVCIRDVRFFFFSSFSPPISVRENKNGAVRRFRMFPNIWPPVIIVFYLFFISIATGNNVRTRFLLYYTVTLYAAVPVIQLYTLYTHTHRVREVGKKKKKKPPP